MEKIKIRTNLKLNDNVVVTTGSDKGKRGKILFIDKVKGKVVVEGVNKRNKFVRRNQENPKGGMINREFPIQISNVMIFCDKCKKGVRVSKEIKGEEKSRVCGKCGKSL